MIVFVMNWNWLSSTKLMCEYLEECGHTPIIVDNNSTYPPLLEWYEETFYKVITTKGIKLETYNRFCWELNLPEIYASGENFYGVSDSDLYLNSIPKDFVEILVADIERSPGILKSGLSLKLDDLPNNPYADRYRQSESKHFSKPDKWGFYDIPVDTTFAIYSKERCNNIDKMWRPKGSKVPDSFLDNFYFYRAHRSPKEYAVPHLPWYMDINNLTEEQLYHINVAKHGSVLFFKQVYRNELKERYNLEVK